MWEDITKEQANAILKLMQEIGAVSIIMPDGADYTPKDIVEYWKETNEKKRERKRKPND